MGAYLSSIDQEDYPRGDAALQINANWTLGPLFFGWTMNLFLCGVVLSWFGSYWKQSSGDKSWVRAAAAVAVVSEVCVAAMNFWSIMDHGKSQDRSNADISLLTDPDALSVMFGAITALATQAFFACRCYRLFFARRWRYSFAILISSLILVGFIAQWGIAIVEFVNDGRTDVTRGASPQAYGQLYGFALAWLFSAVVVDASISGLLIFSLRRNRKLVAEHASDIANSTTRLLNNFIRLQFEAAGSTVLCAIAAAICYVLTTETTNLSYAFSNMLPGFYALSLLWAVRSSHRLREEIRPEGSEMIQLVWGLSENNEALLGNTAGANSANLTAEERAQRLADLVRLGEGRGGNETLSISLRRSQAPPKAVSRLGQNVKVLTVIEGEKSGLEVEIGGLGRSASGSSSARARGHVRDESEGSETEVEKSD